MENEASQLARDTENDLRHDGEIGDVNRDDKVANDIYAKEDNGEDEEEAVDRYEHEIEQSVADFVDE
ncbi:unnamed protein product, partial [Brassica oleracea var. botrytis]